MMTRQRETSTRVVRIARAHVRLLIAAVIGLLGLALAPASWPWATRLLVAWDVGVMVYLFAAAAILRSQIGDIRRRAAEQDEGATLLTLLTVTASLASLGAVFVELARVPEQADRGLHAALGMITVLLSWTFTHTVFALRYAHEFYDERRRAGGLAFPNDQHPDYWDFIYFSFVIGMTFQVSDVAVTDKSIRRMVVAHGVISFLFNTAILALTINVAASVLQSR